MIAREVGKSTSKHPYHSLLQTHIPRYHNFALYQKIFPLEENNPCKTRNFAVKFKKIVLYTRS